MPEYNEQDILNVQATCIWCMWSHRILVQMRVEKPTGKAIYRSGSPAEKMSVETVRAINGRAPEAVYDIAAIVGKGRLFRSPAEFESTETFVTQGRSPEVKSLAASEASGADSLPHC